MRIRDWSSDVCSSDLSLGELRESRLGSSAAHGGQRSGGGQEILLQDGSPGWFDSPSLSDGQRLLPDLWSWSIELDPFRAKPRVRFACPGYGLRAASWWRAAQHRPNRPSPRWTRRRRWRHTAYSAHGKGEWPAPDARPLRTSDQFLKQPDRKGTRLNS